MEPTSPSSSWGGTTLLACSERGTGLQTGGISSSDFLLSINMGFCVILDIRMLFHTCIKIFCVGLLFLCLSRVHWLRWNALCDLLTKRKLTLSPFAYPLHQTIGPASHPFRFWFFIFKPEAWIKWSKGLGLNSQPYFSESVSFSWVVWTLRKLLFW